MFMLSKAKIKLVHALETKKQREQQNLFVAEGPKVVDDLLQRFQPKLFIATADWSKANKDRTQSAELIEVSTDELRKASLLQHPQQVVALFAKPEQTPPDTLSHDSLALALDGVQDPGNLGTIIRIADWFGIDHIYCSQSTADAYNPKVVQATMGSLARVNIVYTDLKALLERLPEDYPVYGTLLDGDNIYSQELTAHGLIIMGNEGNGISEQLRPMVNRRLKIPSYPEGQPTAESLNVAIATALTCAEFRRR